ncbi:IclR family transcriptional regulator [Pseudonocardia zijingensis]|jgi:IclR family acetate operon transcriptional repressor
MRSLERAIDVLEVLENARAPLRLSEIARRAGLHVATTQRILAVLERRERVEHDGMTYRTGVAMLFGAHSYLATSALAQSAHPVLQELASSTGLTTSIFVRTGWSRAVIARVEGTRPLRYELPIGERLPLQLGAGKVLTADMARDEIKQLLDQTGPIVAADGRRITRKAFMAELAKIRQQGFGVAYSERVLGMASVAAPVLRSDGHYAAAVQVSALAEDLKSQELELLSVEVRRAAAAVSQRLP